MFKKLFSGKTKKADQTEAPKLPLAISASIEQFVGRSGVAAMPASAAKAFQVSTNPGAEPNDFTDVIESDEGLSARILKIANSVYFNRGVEINRIDEAVVSIGVSELRGLLNASSLTEMFSSKHPVREQLWENDVATAILSRYLGKRLSSSELDFLFLAGLMHDIGKLLLLEKASAEYEKVIKAVSSGDKNFCSAEEELFPFNHCELGHYLAEKWNFSAELIRVIHDHHYPLDDKHFESKEYSATRIVRAADLLSHSIGIGIGGSSPEFSKMAEGELERVLPKIGMSPRLKDSLKKEARKVYEDERELYDL